MKVTMICFYMYITKISLNLLSPVQLAFKLMNISGLHIGLFYISHEANEFLVIHEEYKLKTFHVRRFQIKSNVDEKVDIFLR